MKKFLSVIAIVLLAVPAFAQDDIVLVGGDIDAVLGGGNRGNRGGNRGNNNNQNQIPDPIFFFEDVKALLKNNKVPLDKNQEKALQTFLNTETQAMRTALEAQFNRGGNQNNGNRGNNREASTITDLSAAVTKYNAELLTEMKASLTPDQVSVVAKAEKDKKACTTLLDLINFQELSTRMKNQANNFNNNRGGGGGGLDLLGLDLGDLGGGGGFPNNGGNRGNNNQIQQIIQTLPNRPSCTSKDSTIAQRLAVLGDVLTKEKKPLTADQSTKFSALIETKLKAMTDEVKAKDREMEQVVNSLNNFGRPNNNQNQNQNQSAQQTPQVNVQTLTNNIVNTIMQNLGVQNSNNNNNNQNNANGRGGRGGGNQNFQNNNQTQNQNQTATQAQNNNQNRGNANQNFNPQAEIQKKNEELYDKVAAMLKPEQGQLVKKVKYDQIKARGPVDRYRGILEEEGAPLTPEQATQIQQILNTTNQAVRTYAQGLVTTEINALEPGALQAAAQQIIQQQQQQQQQQQNQNQDPRQNRGNANNNAVNNVNQNGVAQQIVGKVMPQVSIRKSQQDKVAVDTILTRVLTPAQQASYKVSQIK